MFLNRKKLLSPVLQNGYPVICILSGLFACHLIATAQVYFSNRNLSAHLKVLFQNGYLIVPNQWIMDRLQEFGPAFYGGLFFTLSLGAGLSMTAFCACWIWIRVFSEKRWFLLSLSIPWSFLLLLVNIQGFSPFASACFLLVPALVFQCTRKLIPTAPPGRPWSFGIIHTLPVIVLALLCAWQLDGNSFLRVRDNLLLSSIPGKKCNDFYYQYAFYPAEVFKPYHQKMLKTCRNLLPEKPGIKETVNNKLLENDYLPVENTEWIDLIVRKKGQEILLQQGKTTVVQATVSDFMTMGPMILKEFSQKTDRCFFFRKLVFFSLIAGLPALGYLFFFSLVRFLLTIFLKPVASSLAASFLCFGAGMALLTAIAFDGHEEMPGKTLNERLESGNARERIQALQGILEKPVEISDFEVYQRLLQSPAIPDRYWLAKSLAFSRNPKTFADLLALLDDPSPNVASMAYWALGLRGDRGAIPEILKRLPQSTDWYNQWYAYKALRNLGWTQSKSEDKR